MQEEIVWLAQSWTVVREKPQDGGEPNALNLEGGVLALEPLGTGDSTVTTANHPLHVTPITLFLLTHTPARPSSQSLSFLFFRFLFLLKRTMAARPRLVTHQDTFDLRDQIHPDDHNNNQQGVLEAAYHSDEEHSMLEDDSDGEGGDDYMDDDDGSSSLSIPNESIDFDLVYALHSFAATVEGQANVVKGDSLFLMDDSNSYWWLVRVLKTQEVGYIPAENIETPFERLARLNKHRNVDVRPR